METQIRFPRADHYFLLREDRAGIQFLYHLLHRDAGLRVPREEGMLNGGSASPPRQERTVHVEGGDFWKVQDFLGQDLPEGDDDEEVGGVSSWSLVVSSIVDVFGLEDLKFVALRCDFHG